MINLHNKATKLNNKSINVKRKIIKKYVNLIGTSNEFNFILDCYQIVNDF